MRRNIFFPPEQGSLLLCAILPALIEEHPMPWYVEGAIGGWVIKSKDRHIVGRCDGTWEEADRFIRMVETFLVNLNSRTNRGSGVFATVIISP